MSKMISLCDGNKILHFPSADIIHAEANGSYVIIHLKAGKTMKLVLLLKQLQEKLDAVMFQKIHRSHIVNMNEVRAYEKGRGGEVTMSDGTKVNVSNEHKAELIKRLGL